MKTRKLFLEYLLKQIFNNFKNILQLLRRNYFQWRNLFCPFFFFFFSRDIEVFQKTSHFSPFVYDYSQLYRLWKEHVQRVDEEFWSPQPSGVSLQHSHPGVRRHKQGNDFESLQMEREVLQQSFPLYSGKHSQVSLFKHAVLITVISQRRKKKDRKEKKKRLLTQ